VPDRQPDEQPPQRPAACALDPAQQLGHRQLAEAVELSSWSAVRWNTSPTSLTNPASISAIPSCSRGRRCRALPRRSERSPPAAGRGSRGVGQRVSALASGRTARSRTRTVRRHDELALAAVTQVDDRPDDLRDDVASLAEHPPCRRSARPCA
jgi:hypothetical protein